MITAIKAYITATEASARSREAVNNDIDKKLASVYQSIESVCDKGERMVFIDKSLDPALVKRLKEIGYEVDVFYDAFNGWSRITW